MPLWIQIIILIEDSAYVYTNGRIMLYTTMNDGIFTAFCEYSFETNPFCQASTKFTCDSEILTEFNIIQWFYLTIFNALYGSHSLSKNGLYFPYILCILVLIFPFFMIYFPKSAGKGSFSKSQLNHCYVCTHKSVRATNFGPFGEICANFSQQLSCETTIW